MKAVVGLCSVVLLLTGCEPAVTPPPRESEAIEWAIALHGGAGSVADLGDEEFAAYRRSLDLALTHGASMLDGGAGSLDTVEAVIRLLEDDPLFNAGRGAVLNAAGGYELDASIMDGSNMAAGGVAGVRTVKNPITLARRVMESTPHVLLAGVGAERFADAQQVERVSADYFATDRRRRAWERARDGAAAEGGGTCGVVALDRNGHLAAGTSTGGLTFKHVGRIGDSPIVGAGTYAEDGVVAVSGTGVGEEFIRHGVGHRIAWLVRDRHDSVEQAAWEVVHKLLRPGDGGVIAVAQDGSLAMEFNTDAMFRGAADSTGRHEIAVGRDEGSGGGD